MQGLDIIFSIAVLIMSVVMHEVSHGLVANMLGDPTAKYAGRLTLNPFPHIDLVGSIIVPSLGFIFGGFIIGWAKPVPYNPNNLSNQRWGPALVGAAGPATNIFIALAFSLILRVFINDMPATSLPILFSVVFINILLAIFNLVPIPPLDGSKVLFALLPYGSYRAQEVLEQYGIFILLLFIFYIWPILSPAVFGIFQLFTGFPLQ